MSNIRNIRQYTVIAVIILSFASLSSCGMRGFSGEGYNVGQEGEVSNAQYRLGSGDALRITVFGEEDLSGDFEIDGTGSVAFPLLGEVKAGGLTSRELENALSQKLADGYLTSPKVSVEVSNFRPFFIIGEVNQPGSYPYVDAMTVLNAVALASGYTHRAKEGRAVIVRNNNGQNMEITADHNTRVMPGDTIRIDERLF